MRLLSATFSQTNSWLTAFLGHRKLTGQVAQKLLQVRASDLLVVGRKIMESRSGGVQLAIAKTRTRLETQDATLAKKPDICPLAAWWFWIYRAWNQMLDGTQPAILMTSKAGLDCTVCFGHTSCPKLTLMSYCWIGKRREKTRHNFIILLFSFTRKILIQHVRGSFVVQETQQNGSFLGGRPFCTNH